MLTDEGNISNYPGVNIKKISDGIFELSLSHFLEENINHFRITVFTSLKSKETPVVKPFLHKDESSLGKKCVCNYRSAVCMLSYLQWWTRWEISMDVHKCARFSIICFLCTNFPLDASKITLQARLHMWTYQMEIDDYQQLVYFTGPIRRKG